MRSSRVYDPSACVLRVANGTDLTFPHHFDPYPWWDGIVVVNCISKDTLQAVAHRFTVFSIISGIFEPA